MRHSEIKYLAGPRSGTEPVLSQVMTKTNNANVEKITVTIYGPCARAGFTVCGPDSDKTWNRVAALIQRFDAECDEPCHYYSR